MKTVKTMCARDCYDSCFITAAVREDGTLTSVKGDPDHPITQGFTCPRGAGDVFRVYNNRVLYPWIRIKDKPGRDFERVAWDEVLDRVAGKLVEILNRYGRESVLILDYAGNTGLLTSKFPQRLWHALGVSCTDRALCSVSGQVGLALHYGEAYGIQPGELLNKDLIVFWGFNAPVSSAHMWNLSLQARKQEGTKLIVIDPRQSEAAGGADNYFQPKPGSDVALAMGICRCLIENDRVDQAFIKKETEGFEQLKEQVFSWSPGQVEAETGLDWGTVETIAGAYGNSKQSATMIGIGLQKTINGADLVRAISFIPALLGLYRGFFYSNNDAFYINKNLISGKAFEERQPETIPQAALSEYVKKGAFKFIFIYGMNPALTVPNQSLLREGFSRKDTFVVVHDTHWTETADYADVVLPAPTFFEKQDVVVSWAHRHVRLSQKVIEPLEESRDEVWVMQELARRLKIEEQWVFDHPWQVLEEAFAGSFATGSFRDLLEGKDLILKCKPSDRYNTTSGKLEFYSSTAIAMEWEPLPEHRPLEPEPEEFVLLNSAAKNYTGTQFQEAYGPIPSIVTMNPGDADRLHTREDEWVNVFNRQGSIRLRVKVSNSVPPGVLWSPRQLAGPGDTPMNDLTSGVPQAIGGGPSFNSTLVKIERS